MPPSRYADCGHLFRVRSNVPENTFLSFLAIISALSQLLLGNSYISLVCVLTSIAVTLQSFDSHISRTSTPLSTLHQHHGPIRKPPFRAVQSRRSPCRGMHLPGGIPLQLSHSDLLLDPQLHPPRSPRRQHRRSMVVLSSLFYRLLRKLTLPTFPLFIRSEPYRA